MSLRSFILCFWALILIWGAWMRAAEPVPIAQLNSALLLAAGAGDADAARRLLEAGADPLARNAAGRTPLHVAAGAGHREVCSLLASAPSPSERDRRNAAAAAPRDPGDLFSPNYDPNRAPSPPAPPRPRDEDPLSFVAFLDTMQRNLSATDAKGMIPLHLAVFGGHYETASLLAELGSDANAPDRDGYTPLHLAAALGDDANCAMLVSRGARISLRNVAGATPLQLAKGEAVAKRLRTASERASKGPAADAVRAAVKEFLDAVQKGDARRAAAVSTDEMKKRIPNPLDATGMQMRELSCEASASQAFVEMWLKVPGLTGRNDQHKLTLKLARVGGTWLVAALNDEPYVAALDEPEASR